MERTGCRKQLKGLSQNGYVPYIEFVQVSFKLVSNFAHIVYRVCMHVELNMHVNVEGFGLKK